MMCKYAGIEYENEVVGGPAWAAVKSSQPFDKLPVITLEGGEHSPLIPFRCGHEFASSVLKVGLSAENLVRQAR